MRGLQTTGASQTFEEQGWNRSMREGFGLATPQSLGTVHRYERAEDSGGDAIQVRQEMSGLWETAMKRAGRWSWRASIAVVLLVSVALWYGIARLLSAWLG